MMMSKIFARLMAMLCNSLGKLLRRVGDKLYGWSGTVDAISDSWAATAATALPDWPEGATVTYHSDELRMYTQGLTDADVGDVVRVINKLYMKTHHGEVQLGLKSGNVAVWHKGQLTRFAGDKRSE